MRPNSTSRPDGPHCGRCGCAARRAHRGKASSPNGRGGSGRGSGRGSGAERAPTNLHAAKPLEHLGLVMAEAERLGDGPHRLLVRLVQEGGLLRAPRRRVHGLEQMVRVLRRRRVRAAQPLAVVLTDVVGRVRRVGALRGRRLSPAGWGSPARTGPDGCAPAHACAWKSSSHSRWCAPMESSGEDTCMAQAPRRDCTAATLVRCIRWHGSPLAAAADVRASAAQCAHLEVRAMARLLQDEVGVAEARQPDAERRVVEHLRESHGGYPVLPHAMTDLPSFARTHPNPPE